MGTNFAANVQVTFGSATTGSSASIVSVNPPTSVTVRTDAGARFRVR